MISQYDVIFIGTIMYFRLLSLPVKNLPLKRVGGKGRGLSEAFLVAGLDSPAGAGLGPPAELEPPGDPALIWFFILSFNIKWDMK